MVVLAVTSGNGRWLQKWVVVVVAEKGCGLVVSLWHIADCY